MKQLLCTDCANTLCNDEIALNLKLRGRSTGTFFCLRCFSRRLDCTQDELMQMANFFRENGCELFANKYVNEQGSEHD